MAMDLGPSGSSINFASELEKISSEISSVERKISETESVLEDETLSEKQKDYLREKKKQLREEKIIAIRSLAAPSEGPPPPKKKCVMPSNPHSRSLTQLLQTDLSYGTVEYCHWFAIALYDVWCQCSASASDQDPIKLTLGTETFEISNSDLLYACQAIKKACKIDEDTSFTMLFTRALDMFLFGHDPTKGACLHQAPTRIREYKDDRKVDICDTYCVPLHDGFPIGPILVADLKKSDFKTAVQETRLHAVNAISVQPNTNELWDIVLGIPGSKRDMEGFLPRNKELWTVPIVKAQPYDRALLCTIYYLPL